ncbi:MAG: energy-coupling factor ABC transporter permease [Devosiaceae bacterium]|nr:energy-coupling factor ABC transporter permease [Devosiaceae bacterium]
MHIQLGILDAIKTSGANIGTLAILAASTTALVRKPALALKSALAAIFFSALMQSFHMPVGPSELHLIGASAVYLLFGFLPTLFGFAIGLLLQALLFEPADMLHIGVNSLSLILPLVAAHALFGKRFFREKNAASVGWVNIVKFDAIYYAGVVTMVGIWLSIANVATPFQAWALFAVSYLPLVVIEPLFTFGVIWLLKRHGNTNALKSFTVVNKLKLA